MFTLLIPAIATVLVSIVALIGSLRAGRNDRALTLQELEILEKLSSKSDARGQLQVVINRRIKRWYDKSYAWASTGRFLIISIGSGLALLFFGVALTGQTDEVFDTNSRRQIGESLGWGGIATIILGILGSIFFAIIDLVDWRKSRKSQRNIPAISASKSTAPRPSPGPEQPKSPNTTQSGSPADAPKEG